MRYIVQLTGTQVKYGDDADIFQFQLWENSSNTRTVEDSIVDLTGSVVTVDIANGSGFVGRFVTTTIPEKGIVNIDMSNEVIAKLPADTYYFQVEVVNGDKKKIFPTDGGDIIKIFKSLTETQGELVPRTTIDDVLNKVDEKIAEYTKTIAKGDKGDKGDMDLSQITVGGRNILLGTGNSFTGVGDNSTNGTFNAQGGQYYLAGGKKVSDLYKQYGSSGYLTLSFDWTASGSTISGQFSPVWNNTPWGGLSISGGIQPSITNTSGYYKATVSLKANGYSTGIATGIQFRQDNLQGNITISNVKLEAGNVATDWSPAPEDVDNKIDNISVGGRNYILNSSGIGASASSRPVISGGQMEIVSSTVDYQPDRMVMTNNQGVGEFFYGLTKAWTDITNTPLVAGNTYTLLVKARGTAPQIALRVGFQYMNPAESVGYTQLDSTKWTKATFTFTIPVATKNIFVRINGGINNKYSGFAGNETIEFKEVMLEQSNVASDWVPAPEDVPSNDAQLVHKTGNETVAGDKTFTGKLSVNNLNVSGDTPNTVLTYNSGFSGGASYYFVRDKIVHMFLINVLGFTAGSQRPFEIPSSLRASIPGSTYFIGMYGTSTTLVGFNGTQVYISTSSVPYNANTPLNAHLTWLLP